MSSIRTLAAETTALLKERILSADTPHQWQEIGHVLSVGDGICLASGLEGVQVNEVVTLGDHTRGVVLNLEEHVVGIVILGQDQQVKEWDVVKRTQQRLSVPVGLGLLGRVVDALGRPKDMKGDLQDVVYDTVEKPSPSIMQRQPIFEPLQTGIKVIDAMIPIGRGQRELIVGDRQTGKTAIALDIMLNQKHLNDRAPDDQKVYCIYVAIGQKRSGLTRLVRTLEEAGAMAYCTIVDATASEAAALQFMAPYAACTMGEYFRDRGLHALVVYDDLSKHAVAYREMSLLLRRPPGREAYPGDVFYAHSRLLERAAQLSQEEQGGSLTALPIVETQAGDLSAYIPTNDISITDGQIFLESELFFKGIRPAVNMGLSVSRVGGAAQTQAMKCVAGSLKLELAQFREVEAFAQFGVELDSSLSKLISKGRCLVELMKQQEFDHLSLAHQVISILAGMSGLLENVPLERLREFQREFYLFLNQKHADILETLNIKKQLTPDMKDQITGLLEAFLDIFA